jgi:hypothetical protein
VRPPSINGSVAALRFFLTVTLDRGRHDGALHAGRHQRDPRGHDSLGESIAKRSLRAKLFRGLMLAKLLAAHKAGQLKFFGQHAHLAVRQLSLAVPAWWAAPRLAVGRGHRRPDEVDLDAERISSS